MENQIEEIPLDSKIVSRRRRSNGADKPGLARVPQERSRELKSTGEDSTPPAKLAIVHKQNRQGTSSAVERAIPSMSLDSVSCSGMIDAVLEVGQQRKGLLGEMRAALVSGDDAEALEFARQLCGLAA